MYDNAAKSRLQKMIDGLPRTKLVHLPTPLQEAHRLSKALKGPRIFFKRDDLTGVFLSGNKSRMFEFIIADALGKKAGALLANATTYSNYCRQLTAACNKVGLEIHLVLHLVGESEKIHVQGNLLLDLLAGAQVYLTRGDSTEQHRIMEKIARDLESQGKQPYISGKLDQNLQAVAYVNGFLELSEQLEEYNLHPRYIYVSSAGATQAGLVLANKYLKADLDIIGVHHGVWSDRGPIDATANVTQIGNDAARCLGIGPQVGPGDVHSINTYVGKSYGDKFAKPDPNVVKSIKLTARTEAILLDPIYTGRVMAALIDDIRQGKIENHETVIFWHTGGWPTLFTYSDELGPFENLSILQECSTVRVRRL